MEVRSDGLLKPALPYDRGEAFCSTLGQREDRALPFLAAFPGQTLSLLGMRRREIALPTTVAEDVYNLGASLILTEGDDD